MPQVYRTRFCRATFFAAATSTSPGGLHERPVEPASFQRLGLVGTPAGCRDRLSRPRQPEARHVEDAAVGSDAGGPAVAAEDLGALIGGCVDGGAFWPHGEADFSRPPVRQLERLAHVELEHAKAPAQVLQRPDDRVLHLRRGPLPELVMTQIRLERGGDAGGELAIGLL